MAATYKMAAYRKEISFRNGTTATVRPLERAYHELREAVDE